MISLKERTVSGVKWQVVNKVAQKILTVVTFAVLARILEPSVFGLFALAFVAIDGLQICKNFGIDSALIQHNREPEKATHTAFWIVFSSGLLMALICFAAAPVVSHFFHNEHLISITQALAIIFIFNSFGKIPTTILTKQMRFNLIAIIELIGAFVNCTVAILWALIHPTVWSLVGAYIVKQLTVSLLSKHYSGYRLKFFFDWQIAKELFHFGKFMIGLGIVWYFAQNGAHIIIGKVLGPTMLGYFLLAANIGNFINTHFTHLVSSIMFPAYSSIQSEPEEVKRAYLKTIKFVSMVSLPFAFSLISLSKELVLTIYGDKWLAVVPLIQWFGVVQLVVPIKVCSGAVFMGCGKPNYSFALTFYPLLTQLGLTFLLLPYAGLMGAVIATLISVSVFAPINLYFVQKIVRFNALEFLKQLAPAFLCSFFMLSVILIIKGTLSFHHIDWTSLNHFLLLGFYLLIGLSVYVTSFAFVDRATTLEAGRLLFRTQKT